MRHAGVDLLVLGAVPARRRRLRLPGKRAAQEPGAAPGARSPATVVILDMEAGIEHLGRGTAMGVDLMLAVVEPGRRSVETAAPRAARWPPTLGIRRFGVVLNKSTAPARRRARGSSGEFGPGDAARRDPVRPPHRAGRPRTADPSPTSASPICWRPSAHLQIDP